MAHRARGSPRARFRFVRRARRQIRGEASTCWREMRVRLLHATLHGSAPDPHRFSRGPGGAPRGARARPAVREAAVQRGVQPVPRPGAGRRRASVLERVAREASQGEQRSGARVCRDALTGRADPGPPQAQLDAERGHHPRRAPPSAEPLATRSTSFPASIASRSFTTVAARVAPSRSRPASCARSTSTSRSRSGPA